MSQADAALEHYKALRAEIVERLKMRDQVLLAYLGGVAALIGFSSSNSARFDTLYPALLILVPFLALGASTCVAQHQDTITSFNEYIITDLLAQLSTPAAVFYDSSRAARRHTPNSLWTRFVTQSAVICGPPALLLAFAANGLGVIGPFKADPRTISAGVLLTIAGEARLLWSVRYRSDVHRNIQQSRAKAHG